MTRISSHVAWALLAAPLLVLIAGAVVALVISSSPADIGRQFQEPAVRDALWLSLRTTLVSLLIVLVCGTATALVMQRSPKPVASSLEVLVTLPAVMPPSVAGLALLLAFGRQGLFGPAMEAARLQVAFTTAAVVMAQVFVAAPFYVREAATALSALDRNLLDAGKIDGATPTQLLARVALPIASPFLITGAVLAWARALGEFGATILFAGNMQGVTQTLPLAIYLGFETDLEQAKAVAILLLAAAAAVLVVLRIVLHRRLAFAH